MQMANSIGSLLQMTLYICWDNQHVCLTHESTASIWKLNPHHQLGYLAFCVQLIHSTWGSHSVP